MLFDLKTSTLRPQPLGVMSGGSAAHILFVIDSRPMAAGTGCRVHQAFTSPARRRRLEVAADWFMRLSTSSACFLRRASELSTRLGGCLAAATSTALLSSTCVRCGTAGATERASVGGLTSTAGSRRSRASLARSVRPANSRFS